MKFDREGKRRWKHLADEDLVKEYLVHKEESVFSEIYTRYNDRIFNYMKKYIYYCPEDIIQELLAEVFIKVYLNISTIKDVKSFKSWIYHIAHNITVNFIKGQKEVYTDADNILPQAEDKRINIEEEFMDNEVREFVFNEIKKYDDKIRELIIFKFYHNLTFDEISDITHIPLRTLKYKLKHALIDLGEKLKQAGLCG
ncbi:MAG: sigma-70 family RNA polymerase sigma factor [Spirochaetes bacterium]|nr:sigma-70 family RNA polymerase sigma factor [Spirochaetota bacterium]